ncbi:hypothetical protein JZM26_23700 [Escherichia coli]|uniref:hypothetical protein n=1 Tax=Escherichia coli TaxID=562 RepID=UPI0014324B51|nr:hypothetical protein [Escherichia coli]MBN6463645.1 hypothetical protein [Escherichia coli]NJS08073.1 hypothetical protein [Escherichia coli]
MNPFYQKINAPSREVLELVLKIAAKVENHSSTIAAFVCAANDAPEKRVNMSSPEAYNVITRSRWKLSPCVSIVVA